MNREKIKLPLAFIGMRGLTGKLLAVSIFLLSSNVFASSYGDPQDSDSGQWTVFDNIPEGATVETVYDEDLDRQVYSLTSYYAFNGFELGSYTPAKGWKDTESTVVNWRMKTNSYFNLYVSLTTDLGHRHFTINNQVQELRLEKPYIRLGLGETSTNNMWQDHEFDLEAILQQAEPSNKLLQVNGVLFRGTARISPIVLSSSSDLAVVDSSDTVDESIVIASVDTVTTETEIETGTSDVLEESAEQELITVGTEESPVEVESSTSFELTNETTASASESEPAQSVVDEQVEELIVATNTESVTQNYAESFNLEYWKNAEIVFVTSLADSASNPQPGQLRYALNEVSGPRIVVFKVSGTIVTDGTLHIRSEDSGVYIAGQTAPGGGITIRGKGTPKKDLIRITNSNNVVLEYLRLRLGKGTTPGTGDSLSIIDSSYIHVDHLSASWSNDENIGIWASGDADVTNISVQNSILSEPLGPHATNFLISSKPDYTNKENAHESAKKVTKLFVHKNVMTHATHRAPQTVSRNTLISNNVIFNWKHYSFAHVGYSEVDFVDNRLIEGHYSTDSGYAFFAHQTFAFDGTDQPEDRYDVNDPKVFYLPLGSIHHARNNVDYYNPTKTDGVLSDWDEYIELVGLSDRFYKCDGTDWRCLSNNARQSPLDYDLSSLGILDADQALEDDVLENAGASFRLDCNGQWVDNRDAIDKRVVSEIISRAEVEAPLNQDVVGGYLNIASVTPCSDNNGNGLPDSYESTYSLTDVNGDSDDDGVPNLIEYLRGTNP